MANAELTRYTNPPLWDALSGIAARGQMTEQDAAAVVQLAGKLSGSEEKAIRHTLRRVEAVDPRAQDALDGWMASERRHRRLGNLGALLRNAFRLAPASVGLVLGMEAGKWLIPGAIIGAGSAVAAAAGAAVLCGTVLGSTYLVARAVPRCEGPYGTDD